MFHLYGGVPSTEAFLVFGRGVYCANDGSTNNTQENHACPSRNRRHVKQFVAVVEESRQGEMSVVHRIRGGGSRATFTMVNPRVGKENHQCIVFGCVWETLGGQNVM